MSQVNGTPSGATGDYGHEDVSRVHRTDAVAARTLDRWSTRTLAILLGLGLLVLALGYFAMRRAGVFPGANGGSAVIDTTSSGGRGSGGSDVYGPTGNSGGASARGGASNVTTDGRASGGAGGVMNGGVPSTGSQVGGSAGSTSSTGAASSSGGSSAIGGATSSGFGGR